MNYFRTEFKKILNNYLLIVSSFSLIFFVQNIVSIASDFSEIISYFEIVKISFINISFSINQISIIISFFTAFFYMKKMITNEELVIYKVSGLSNFSILKPAIYFQILVFIVMTFNSFFLIKFLQKNLRMNIKRINQSHLLSKIKKSEFFSIGDNFAIYFDEISKDSLIKNLILMKMDDNSILLTVSNDSKIIKNKDSYLIYFLDSNSISIKSTFDVIKLSAKEENSIVDLDTFFVDSLNKSNSDLSLKLEKGVTSENIIELIDNFKKKKDYRSKEKLYSSILNLFYSLSTGITCLVLMSVNYNSRIYSRNVKNKVINLSLLFIYILMFNVLMRFEFIVMNYIFIMFLIPICVLIFIILCERDLIYFNKNKEQK